MKRGLLFAGISLALVGCGSSSDGGFTSDMSGMPYGSWASPSRNRILVHYPHLGVPNNVLFADVDYYIQVESRAARYDNKTLTLSNFISGTYEMPGTLRLAFDAEEINATYSGTVDGTPFEGSLVKVSTVVPVAAVAEALRTETEIVDGVEAVSVKFYQGCDFDFKLTEAEGYYAINGFATSCSNAELEGSWTAGYAALVLSPYDGYSLVIQASKSGHTIEREIKF
ncbi:hypothetical protein [Thaumasiovibrio subtropicus]|uniref:hypothetical protein n=1 Tax=Thaumasiovibrio subtropicus TaxID=1891207 RepID=UPI000B35216E|nr:hypothetical protein [Thaumasiovibrio subtropicus]